MFRIAVAAETPFLSAASREVIGGQCICRFLADAVEKRFCGPRQARLIQDELGVRNIDSRDRLPRSDCCAFLFYSFAVVTFRRIDPSPTLVAQRFRRCGRTV
jgi:hypothetical protein